MSEQNLHSVENMIVIILVSLNYFGAFSTIIFIYVYHHSGKGQPSPINSENRFESKNSLTQGLEAQPGI